MSIIPHGKQLDAATSVQRILTKEGALVNGDFNDQAVTGQLAIDITNGFLFINTGTLAATVWVTVGSQL